MSLPGSLLSPLVSTARFSWSTFEGRIATSKAQGNATRFLAVLKLFCTLLDFLQLHTSFLLETVRIFLLVPMSDTNVTREEKPLSCGFRGATIRYEILARKMFMWHTNCPKLSSYKHRHTQTHGHTVTLRRHLCIG